MPPVTELHMGWGLGQQSSSNILNMPEGSLVLARNCDIGPDRSIKIRRALNEVTGQITVSDLPQEILSVEEYQNGSTKEVIIAAGTKWYKWDATDTALTTTALSGLTGQTAGSRVSFVRWRDTSRNWVIGGQTGMDTQYYDGNNVQNLGLSKQFKIMETHQAHLFGATDSSNLLWFSDFSNPTNVKTTSAFGLNDRRGGDITMIGAHGDVLLYAGRNMTNILTGRTRQSFSAFPLSPRVGCISHESFQSTTIGAMWADEDGIYVFNGGEPFRLSAPIDDFFRSIDFSKLSNMWSAFYRSPTTRLHKYVLALSRERARTNETIVEYTVETNGWVIRTGDQALAYTVGHDTNDMDVLYAANGNAIVSKWDQVSDKRSVPINFNVIDRPFTFFHPLAEKVLQRLVIYYQADKQATLDIRLTSDFRGEAKTFTKTLIADSTVPTQYQFEMLPAEKSFLQSMSSRELVVAEGIGLEGRHFQVQIQNQEGGRSFRIQAIGMEANIDKEHWNPSVRIAS